MESIHKKENGPTKFEPATFYYLLAILFLLISPFLSYGAGLLISVVKLYLINH
jgi:hypothetical protein